MGVGTPHDMLEAVARGIDMFDCVMPTRNGRHGMAFTRFGPLNLANARHAADPRPLDEESPHPAARTYSRAYLHHLMKANEMLGAVLLSTINLAYYQALMAGMREAIAGGRFADFRAATLAGWEQGDIPRRCAVGGSCLAPGRLRYKALNPMNIRPDFLGHAASPNSSCRRGRPTPIATCSARRESFPMRRAGATRRKTRPRKCWRRCTPISASSAR